MLQQRVVQRGALLLTDRVVLAVGDHTDDLDVDGRERLLFAGESKAMADEARPIEIVTDEFLVDDRHKWATAAVGVSEFALA